MIKPPKNNLNLTPYHGKNILYYRRPEIAIISKTALTTDETNSLFYEIKEIYKKEDMLSTVLLENDIIPASNKE